MAYMEPARTSDPGKTGRKGIDDRPGLRHLETHVANPHSIIPNTNHNLSERCFGKKPQNPQAHPQDGHGKVIEIRRIHHVNGNDSRNVEWRYGKPPEPILTTGDISQFQGEDMHEHAKGQVNHSKGSMLEPAHYGA